MFNLLYHDNPLLTSWYRKKKRSIEAIEDGRLSVKVT